MWTLTFALHTILAGIVLSSSSPVIDFQFLLDPKEAQATLDKLDKVSEAVERKRVTWAVTLKEVEANEANLDSPELHHLHESLQSLNTPAEYKDLLDKYGKLRATKEKGDHLKEQMLTAESFVQNMEALKDLLGVNSDYIQFSAIRALIKTLRGQSFDLFSPAEAATDFAEICVDILTIRKPSVDLKRDYKELCF